MDESKGRVYLSIGKGLNQVLLHHYTPCGDPVSPNWIFLSAVACRTLRFLITAS